MVYNRPLRTVIKENSLVHIGIPKKFVKTTIDQFDTFDSSTLNDIKDYVSSYINNLPKRLEENTGIFFSGSNGVGKTMLASIILREAYIHRFSVMRTTFVDYIKIYTDVWSSTSLSEKEELTENLYSNYKSKEFLVLEEIGKEVSSKVGAPILEDLLRHREDKGLPTIICTNLSIKDIQDKYGVSCYSLIKGNCTPIIFSDKDRRVLNYKDGRGEE